MRISLVLSVFMVFSTVARLVASPETPHVLTLGDLYEVRANAVVVADVKSAEAEAKKIPVMHIRLLLACEDELRRIGRWTGSSVNQAESLAISLGWSVRLSRAGALLKNVTLVRKKGVPPGYAELLPGGREIMMTLRLYRLELEKDIAEVRRTLPETAHSPEPKFSLAWDDLTKAEHDAGDIRYPLDQ